MIGYRLEQRISAMRASTAVKVPRHWTSSLDRKVSTTKLCIQNISILLSRGASGEDRAAASGFPFSRPSLPFR